jgi:hypothetical protein
VQAVLMKLACRPNTRNWPSADAPSNGRMEREEPKRECREDDQQRHDSNGFCN